MARKHSVTSLPKWAQERIADLEISLRHLNLQYDNLQRAHTLLMGREWFPIGDVFGTEKPVDYRDGGVGLWILSDQRPFQVCRIYPSDVLVIGRDERRGGFGRDQDREKRREGIDARQDEHHDRTGDDHRLAVRAE